MEVHKNPLYSTENTPPLFNPSNLHITQWISQEKIRSILSRRKIHTLHKIQAEAIYCGLFFHKNFLICTPSGSGKTLIAELAILYDLFYGKKCSLYLVPYKALAAEKAEYFENLLRKEGFKVISLTGDTDPNEDNSLEDVNLIITTYEKCDALLRTTPSFFSKVSLIVIDEIHEISSPARGPRLELLITLLMIHYPFLQIIALSATINNYHQFNAWLSSFHREFILIHHNKRPIELVYSFEISQNKLTPIRKHIKRVLNEKGQVIIFVNRRKDCIRFGHSLQFLVKKFLNEKEKEECKQASKLLKKKRSFAVALQKMIEFGVAYHNASLGKFERELVETLYRKGIIKTLIATTTLAAGVNTPARTVIIASIFQKQQYLYIEENPKEGVPAYSKVGWVHPISPNLMFQMLGRAGRLGYDSKGEGILIVSNKDQLEFAQSYYFRIEKKKNHYHLLPKYADLTSFLDNRLNLEEAALLFIYYFPGKTLKDLEEFLKKTMFYFNHITNTSLTTSPFAFDPNPTPTSSYSHNTYLHSFQRHKDNITDKSLSHLSYPLLKALNIIPLTYEEFLDFFITKTQKNTSSHLLFPSLSHYKAEITASDPFSLSGKIFDLTSRFHISFHKIHGIRCSCMPGKAIKVFPPSFKKTHPSLLCDHIRFFILKIAENGTQEEKDSLKSIITSLLRSQSIIPFLLEEGFIYREFLLRDYTPFTKDSSLKTPLPSLEPSLPREEYISSTLPPNDSNSFSHYRFYPTEFGKLTVRLYIYPSQIIKIRNWLSSLHSFELSYVLRKIFLIGEDFSYSIEDAAHVVYLWIEEYTMNYILSQYPMLGIGDIFSILSHAKRNIGLFSHIASFLGKELLANSLSVLQYRVEYGCKEELIDIIERFSPLLNRNKARILYDAGFHSARDIVNEPLPSLQEKTGLKHSLLIKMKKLWQGEHLLQSNLKDFFPS